MLSAKNFLKTYGVVGVYVYGGVTTLSIGSMYLALRTGKADTMIITPLEQVLGADSEMVQTIKQKLGDANKQSSSSALDSVMDERANASSRHFNGVREGAYFGIATLVDSLLLPIKLAVCLPVAKAILKRRGI